MVTLKSVGFAGEIVKEREKKEERRGTVFRSQDRRATGGIEGEELKHIITVFISLLLFTGFDVDNFGWLQGRLRLSVVKGILVETCRCC